MVLLGFVFDDIAYAYPIYMGATAVCAVLTCIAGNGAFHSCCLLRVVLNFVASLPSVGQEKNKRETFDLTFEDIKECYRISPESHGDFFWVFVIRTFYYLSLSIQAFFLFYLRDILKAPHPKEPLAVIVVLGQVWPAYLALSMPHPSP